MPHIRLMSLNNVRQQNPPKRFYTLLPLANHGEERDLSLALLPDGGGGYTALAKRSFAAAAAKHPNPSIARLRQGIESKKKKTIRVLPNNPGEARDELLAPLHQTASSMRGGYLLGGPLGLSVPMAAVVCTSFHLVGNPDCVYLCRSLVT